eukprot:14231124-Heterocapsa_arctica.AAC.1
MSPSAAAPTGPATPPTAPPPPGTARDPGAARRVYLPPKNALNSFSEPSDVITMSGVILDRPC